MKLMKFNQIWSGHGHSMVIASVIAKQCLSYRYYSVGHRGHRRAYFLDRKIVYIVCIYCKRGKYIVLYVIANWGVFGVTL